MPERLLNISRLVILGVLGVTTLLLVVVIGVSTLPGTGPLRTQVLDGGDAMVFPGPEDVGGLPSESAEGGTIGDVTSDPDNISDEAWSKLQDLAQNPDSVRARAQLEFNQFLDEFGSAIASMTDSQTALLDMNKELWKASQPETQPF